MAEFVSNTDEIAIFSARSIATFQQHGPKSVCHEGRLSCRSNRQFQERDCAGEEETYPVMKHHVYTIAVTLTSALVKQFPTKFN